MLHFLQAEVRGKQFVGYARERRRLSLAIPAPEDIWSCRQIEGSLPCAKKTLDILRLIVTNKKHTTAAALIDEMRTVGYKMQTARPVGKRILTQSVS